MCYHKTRINIQKILFLILAFICVSCSFIKKDIERSKQIKSNILTAIKLLENQNFVGMKGRSSNNNLIFDGKINNISTSFTLDSGATSSYINYSYAKKLHLIDNISKKALSEIGTAFGSVNKGEMLEIPVFTISGLEFSNWPVHLVDSRFKKLTIGSDFLIFNNSVLFCKYGILMNSVDNEKADSLHAFLIKNDFATTSLVNPFGYEYTDDIPDFQNILFFIKTIIDGEEQLMLVDTGADFTTAFREHSTYLQSDIKRTNTRLVDASGKSKSLNITYIDSMMIQNFCFLKNNKLAIVDNNLTIGDAKVYGTLGLDLLAKKGAVLDFGNKIMYFLKD